MERSFLKLITLLFIALFVFKSNTKLWALNPEEAEEKEFILFSNNQSFYTSKEEVEDMLDKLSKLKEEAKEFKGSPGHISSKVFIYLIFKGLGRSYYFSAVEKDEFDKILLRNNLLDREKLDPVAIALMNVAYNTQTEEFSSWDDLINSKAIEKAPLWKLRLDEDNGINVWMRIPERDIQSLVKVINALKKDLVERLWAIAGNFLKKEKPQIKVLLKYNEEKELKGLGLLRQDNTMVPLIQYLLRTVVRKRVRKGKEKWKRYSYKDAKKKKFIEIVEGE